MSEQKKPPLTVEEALSRVLAGVAPGASETVPLHDAHCRVLAEPVMARFTQPPFDASAMDGYAVRSIDVASLPARLRVIGESAAGHGFDGIVATGQAVRIFTGAPMPTGTDAVVIQENTRRDGDAITVQDGQPDRDHVRPRGGDFSAGSVVIAAGTRLAPRHLTLAAAAGHATVAVRRKPVVAILATGDELVLPSTDQKFAPGPDQIVCSNPFGVAAMIRAAGAMPLVLGIARDTRQSLDEYISRASGADILVTLGGASVGDHDLVGPVLAARGMTLDFWNIAMRPGKPMMFGRLGAQRVLGLPGNPVSSLITTRLFVVPLIEALLGRASAPAVLATVPLAEPLEANGPRAHYMRGVFVDTPAGRSVRALDNQDSSLLTPLAVADCLIVRPIRAPAAPAGQRVPVLPLDF